MFKKLLPWVIFAMFGYFLVGNNFSAKLGIIDDHEIAMFLGSDGKVSMNEIPSEIMRTEVGQWGTNLRYRPSYYALRVLETSLWRDNATLWYISRYLMLVVSMVLGFKLLTLYFPQIVSYMFVFYAMTMPFWPDMLTRLGPSEMYALPAVLLFVYGITQNKLWMISLGYIIAVGSKENLLFMFPLLLLWAYFKIKNKSITKNELWATLIMSLYTIFITTSILVATSRAQVDFYGQQISYRYRITRFVWDIPKIIMNRHMLPALAVLLAGIAMSYKKLSSVVASHVGVMLLILATVATQYIFYVNLLPSNMRYDFPALLLFPVLDLVAIHTIPYIFAKYRYVSFIKNASYVAIVLLFSIYIFRRGYTLVHLQSARNVANSTKFDQELRKVIEVIKESPDSKLVYVSQRFIDFEPVISLSRYLTANKIHNEMILSYTREPKLSDPLGLELEDRFVNSMNGVATTDQSFASFSPISGLSTPCYSITFGESLPLPTCPEIADF